MLYITNATYSIYGICDILNKFVGTARFINTMVFRFYCVFLPPVRDGRVGRSPLN